MKKKETEKEKVVGLSQGWKASSFQSLSIICLMVNKKLLGAGKIQSSFVLGSPYA